MNILLRASRKAIRNILLRYDDLINDRGIKSMVAGHLVVEEEGISAANAGIIKRIAVAFNDVDYNFKQLHNWVSLAGGIAFVYQKLTIAATDLATTEVANDTLKTTGAPIGFRWDDPRCFRSIHVEPATGVYPWDFVWDRKAHITPSIQHVVDPVTGAITHETGQDAVTQVYAQPTYLQRLRWTAAAPFKLSPLAWEVGQNLELLQLIPAGVDALEP